jgi:V8-like Glu-specific endopeptidase
MKRSIAFLLACCASFAAHAEEGMWTFDNPPRASIKQAYGVELTDAWLKRLRLATIRLEQGCTASFISRDGLILTNHHCAASCIADNSTAERDLLTDGFRAANRGEELRCQAEAASVLVDTQNVTDTVLAAVKGLPDAEANTARKQQLTQLEQTCEDASAKDRKTGPLKCEAVTLYQGGQYWIYKYKRYDDVRLVLAPESAMGSFGGDPDNFQFPRYTLDFTLLRAYEKDGSPVKIADPLRVNWDGAAEGDAVFISGHPGGTDRLLTTAQLKAQRDAFLPVWLLRYAELRGRLIQYGKQSPESLRRSQDNLDQIENAIKVRRKQLDALHDDAFMTQRAKEEAALKATVAANPELKAIAGNAWDDIEKAQQTYRNIMLPYIFTEGAAGFNSDLYVHARALVRAAAERGKPNTERLREYTDAALPQRRQQLAAETPIYPDLEEVRLSFALERMREWLGPDDKLVRSVLRKESPDSLAASLIGGSKLADPKVRLALYEGGQAAIDASDDPMIKLALLVDPVARDMRKRYEDQVEGPTRSGQESIAKARFATLGTGIYPDATFTLRLSYGRVKGWVQNGQPVPPFTVLQTAFDRATGLDPFRLPQSWLDAAPSLDLKNIKANFITTNDIVGGNSGSPMVNAKGEIVGVAFDGNIHSISGSYWFDERQNRTIGVHTNFIRAALEKVYKADWILQEIN